MIERHYQEQISAFANDELPAAVRQKMAEHFLCCEACRQAHDTVKRAAAWAVLLPRANAPADSWAKIDAAILGARRLRSTTFSWAWFGVAAAAALALVFSTALLSTRSARPAGAMANSISRVPALPVQPSLEPADRPASIALNQPSGSPRPEVIRPTSPEPLRPRTAPAPSATNPADTNSAGWDVQTLSGRPNVSSGGSDSLAVGGVLETDTGSRARIRVANIGEVEVAPNSRVRLIRSTTNEHRLALDRGSLHAKIDAPPRLFIVDTPSAVAVDLGCEYTLEVDPAGNSKLHVTAGFVSLERDGREALVPAGAYCLTKRGQGIGTPYFGGSTPAFEAALAKFDFGRGGAASLATIVQEAGAEDTLTLWHLLPRTNGTDREKVFAALLRFVELPPGVTRAGILKLDQKMLGAWRKAMEELWFG